MELARALTILATALCLSFFGCGDYLGRVGSYKFGDDLTQDRPIEDQVEEEDSTANECDGGPDRPEDDSDYSSNGELDMALEEVEMEDSDALAAVIKERLSATEVEASYRDAEANIPPAHINLQLSKRECMARLTDFGVQFEEPGFDTPGVHDPLLLTGPVAGVSIEPRWPQKNGINAVMDCHLVLALVAVAEQASNLGIGKILFYSTYRPLKPPPSKCENGRAGKKCRRLKENYEKAMENPSQHRRALAIDIRWLVTDQGETLDVLKHFDLKSKEPPCEYVASKKEGKILSDFVCGLYKKHVFNVMLTPNANKAHHNHFHFDLTPDASWYIIR